VVGRYRFSIGERKRDCEAEDVPWFLLLVTLPMLVYCCGYCLR